MKKAIFSMLVAVGLLSLGLTMSGSSVLARETESGGLHHHPERANATFGSVMEDFHSRSHEFENEFELGHRNRGFEDRGQEFEVRGQENELRGSDQDFRVRFDNGEFEFRGEGFDDRGGQEFEVRGSENELRNLQMHFEDQGMLQHIFELFDF